ncbi:hypothetical protein MJT46_007578 [Ovis ammon polii x Ovis aries]|nr:hypothetical protein MJT46_007578 [Ovis ammon polii x Ovis aries]
MCAASVLHSLPCIPLPEDLEAILDFFSFTDHPVGAASPLPCQTARAYCLLSVKMPHLDVRQFSVADLKQSARKIEKPVVKIREPEILLPTVFRAVKQFSSDFHKERKNVLIFIKSKVIDILVNLALKEVSRIHHFDGHTRML